MKKLTTKEFIEKAKKVHGDEYDYSQVVYEKSILPVKIICKKHGVFLQTPKGHLCGKGCYLCYGYPKSSTKEFIEKAKKVHGDEYDYSQVNYFNNSTKVCIRCPIHGEFWQSPRNHLNGQGCPKCGALQRNVNSKWTTDKFIKEANKIHGSKYNYTKTKYEGMYKKVTITCPLHGDFMITPASHIYGHSGCAICGRIMSNKTKMLSNDSFIQKAKKVHGDRYGYEAVDYQGYDNKVKIYCPIHGYFEQSPDSHLQGKGCMRCSHDLSTAEDEIVKYLTDHGIKVEQRKRDIISPYEIDIFLPEYKIGIEYDGLYWHSEEYKDKNYHLQKTNYAEKCGIQLIHIFEDEFLMHKDIVLSKIMHIIHKDNKRIMARKCVVKECNFGDVTEFLNNNHIQGAVHGSVYLCAYYNQQIVAVMVFIKRNNDYELVRFATLNGYVICGIGGKLFNYFIKTYNPLKIISFADRRWTTVSNHTLYDALGFEKERILKPDYRYYIKNGKMERIHKFNFRKKNLHKKYGFPLTMSETEMARKLNAVKIYDCGLIKYVWKKEN